MRFLLWVLFLLVMVSVGVAEDTKYPTGQSRQSFAGLEFELILPELPEEEGAKLSMIVILHGNGGTATGMAGSLQPLVEREFIVCAPKSTGVGWSDADVKAVKSIVSHLLEVLPVGQGRLHAAGFSNGGWNLEGLVMNEELSFVSACWVAAGYRGAKVPKRARTGMAGLALVGTEDGNRSAAEASVGLLADKIRSMECRMQEGIGHEWPGELMPYYFHWLEVMEGRLVAGDDRSFEWNEDEAAALEEMASSKRAGLLWFYAAGDVELPEGRALQQEVFHDRLVRRFGSQLVAIKLSREEHEERFAELKLKKTPALVVLKPSGKKLKAVQGKIPAAGLGKLLRAVAPDPSLPD